MEMFIRQAAKQFELFTDTAAPRDYMTETLRRAMSAARTVVAPTPEETTESRVDADDDED
jgi:hypothetical protein